MIRRRILARTTGLIPYCLLYPIGAYRFHRAAIAPHPGSTTT